MWWEDVLFDACDVHPVRGLDVDGRFWSEVDYIENYQRILDHLGVNADAHELLLQKSFWEVYMPLFTIGPVEMFPQFFSSGFRSR